MGLLAATDNRGVVFVPLSEEHAHGFKRTLEWMEDQPKDF